MNAKQIAQFLHERCALHYGMSNEDPLRRKNVHRSTYPKGVRAIDIRRGDRWLAVGPIRADAGTWRFTFEEREHVFNYESKRVWAVDIIVTRERNVEIEEIAGKAPEHMLACALSGPD